ncbi:beta-lactamase family protein [Chitinophaga horti]|uniref:Beta-lactamase family protein n=1 Tax=Chitinophaga horti TaxID=2920382 RepID=A0ABY6IYG2_9BACT|nr:serine hydrolase domain-containing protein [Chitinophaga horti]UYQ91447.1 beta-lactamase family protein [Chitinophaga horti]
MKLLKVPDYLFTLWTVLFVNIAHAQVPADVKDAIIAVENSLTPEMIISADSTIPSMNIYQRMRDLHVKGVSIAVIYNYQIVWVKGYGMADELEKRSVNANTLFQAASISKSINSMALLKLVQMGRLDLDTDVNRYLTTWKFPYDSAAAGKVITARQLLSHSAGLTVSGFPGYNRRAALPALIQVLNGTAPANSPAVRSFLPPATRFEYSGGGTNITQLLLTDITGEPYEQFLQREVLNPLGMTRSRYALCGDTSNIATAYYRDGKPVNGKYHLYPELAAAGLWTTPTDIARYMIECQRVLRGDSGKVLSRVHMQERFKPVVMYNESKVGLGLFLRYKNGAYYFNHNGGNAGFSCASYGSLEDGYGIVVMTNSSNNAFMLEVCNAVARVYHWDRFFVPRFEAAVQKP